MGFPFGPFLALGALIVLFVAPLGVARPTAWKAVHERFPGGEPPSRAQLSVEETPGWDLRADEKRAIFSAPMFAVVAHRDSETNLGLVGARPGGGCRGPFDAVPRRSPSWARETWRSAGSTCAATSPASSPASGRSASSAARDVLVLNPPSTLLTAHDKLLTARELARSGVPHPRTRLLLPGDEPPALDGPVVLKPRFGSWGRDVHLCRDEAELERALAEVSERRWFASQGALAPGSRPAARLRPARARRGPRGRSARSAGAPPPASGGRTSRSAGRASRRSRPATPASSRSPPPRPPARRSSASTCCPSTGAGSCSS